MKGEDIKYNGQKKKTKRKLGQANPDEGAARGLRQERELSICIYIYINHTRYRHMLAVAVHLKIS